MAVRVKIGYMTAVYESRTWRCDVPEMQGLLNTCRDAARGYWPEAANAVAILQKALGPTGWEIISYDDEPIDPNVVY